MSDNQCNCYTVTSCGTYSYHKAVPSSEQIQPTDCKVTADRDLRKKSVPLLQEVLVLDGWINLGDFLLHFLPCTAV